jgi:hypothetical protein
MRSDTVTAFAEVGGVDRALLDSDSLSLTPRERIT